MLVSMYTAKPTIRAMPPPPPPRKPPLMLDVAIESRRFPRCGAHLVARSHSLGEKGKGQGRDEKPPTKEVKRSQGRFLANVTLLPPTSVPLCPALGQLKTKEQAVLPM